MGGCPLTGRKGTPALLTAHPGPVGSGTYPSIKTLQCCSGEPQLHIPSPPSPLPWTEQGAAHRRPWGSSITPFPISPALDRVGGCSHESVGLPHHPCPPCCLPSSEQSGGLLSRGRGAPPIPPAVSPPLDGVGGYSEEAVRLGGGSGEQGHCDRCRSGMSKIGCGAALASVQWPPSIQQQLPAPTALRGPCSGMSQGRTRGLGPKPAHPLPAAVSA